MPDEKTTVWFGEVARTMGEDASAVLAQLPDGIYPEPEPACATCPVADWYLTKKALRCFCAEHRFIAWVSNEDPVIVCDARERRLRDGEAAGEQD